MARYETTLPARTSITRRAFLAGSTAAMCAALAGSAPPSRKFRKFILISVDTLRADHLGCYGYDLATSPGIDAFASQALRFENAFAAAPSTCPSVTAMHTSRYPGRNEGLLSNGWITPPLSSATLAQTLAAAGLETAALVGNYVLRPATGPAKGFKTYDATLDSSEVNRDMRERVCTSLTPAAVEWLEKHRDKPFFLWLHYQDPHGPYTPPEPFASRFIRRDGGEPHPLALLDNQSGFGGLPAYQQLSGQADLDYYKSRYDGEIAFFDSAFSTLWKSIRRLKLDDDTVIIFTSDHGEAFGENNYYCCHGHGVGPELTRVPLLVRIPGTNPGTSLGAVSLVDIAPTICSLAGVEQPKSFTGENLLSLSDGKRTTALIAETSFAVAAAEGRYYFTWGISRPETGKVENIKVSAPGEIEFRSAPMALYDIFADPRCERDIKDAASDWFRYLRGVCQKYMMDSTAYLKEWHPPEMDEDTKAALRTLGYLDN